MGTCPSSLTDSCQSPPLTRYSSLARSRPRYVACRSLHSAGIISLLLVLNLLLAGKTAFSRNTSRIRTLSLFLSSGLLPSFVRTSLSSGVSRSPSRNTLVPMSFKAASINFRLSRRALKESMWGWTAATRAGKAVWSLGGDRKSFSRRRVSKSAVHRESVGGSFGGCGMIQ